MDNHKLFDLMVSTINKRITDAENASEKELYIMDPEKELLEEVMEKYYKPMGYDCSIKEMPTRYTAMYCLTINLEKK